MKQTASKSPKKPVTVNASSDLKALIAKAEKTEQAVLKAHLDFEKKQTAYKEALQNEPAKNVFFRIWSAMKIARLAYKIKRTEYKLAKNEYKYAKKAAKKGNKGDVAPAVSISKPKEKKTKETKKVAA